MVCSYVGFGLPKPEKWEEGFAGYLGRTAGRLCLPTEPFVSGMLRS
jgi:hypothetical protein